MVVRGGSEQWLTIINNKWWWMVVSGDNSVRQWSLTQSSGGMWSIVVMMVNGV